MTIIYTAHATTKGGRNGHSETDDGTLKLDLASPGGPKSKPGVTTNPEQLFACGYSACFGGALEFLGKQQGIDASQSSVAADVNLHKGDDGFSLSVTLHVTLPGVPQDAANKLVQATHAFCPYSKATRGNIKVDFTVNKQALAAAA